MTQEINNYFCLVQHDTPLHNPHLAGLSRYFLQFDRRVIETSLDADHLIQLITVIYAVDKFDNIDEMIASIDVTNHHPDVEGNYTTLFKDKERERQELMVTFIPVRGTFTLSVEQEDGKEVQV